jgi:predicted enzyme related to lactoylglutathione lyase
MRWQIVTKNPTRLADFYRDLFDWEINTNNALNYRMVDSGTDRGITGGIWPAPPEAPSFVQLFIEVDDIDAAVAKAAGLGGQVIIPPQLLPDGDRLAILRDPEGIPFGVFVPGGE